MRETEEEDNEKERKKRKLRKTSFRKGKIRKYSNGSPCLDTLRHGLKKEEGTERQMVGTTENQDKRIMEKHP